MLFFKPKPRSNEILPPPPPDSDLELEEESKPSLFGSTKQTPVIHSQLPEKHKFFDEIINSEKAETFPEEDEFKDLVKGIEKPKKKRDLKKMPITKKPSIAKKLKIKDTRAKKTLQVIPVKKGIASKQAKKYAKEQTAEIPKPEDTGLEDLDFELPQELQTAKEDFGLPEKLEDFKLEEFDAPKQRDSKKPNEVLEAEIEIKSAIESIKKQERPSFLKRLFIKKPKERELVQEPPSLDKVSLIKDNIKKAREALMKFDLETAKTSYIEIMQLYNQIKPEEQARVYHDINNLYTERKSAEDLKA